MKVFLVRHAQSSPSRVLPDPKWPLSEVGCNQAEALVRILAPLNISEFFTSPYVRCVATIDPFIRSSGTPVTRMEGLREHKIVDKFVNNFQKIWDRCWSDFDFSLDNCESSSAAQSRMRDAVMKICKSSSADTIGISSHGNVIGLLLNSIDASFSVTQTQSLLNPDIVCLTYHDHKLVFDRTFKSPNSLVQIATRYKSTPIPKN
ncbi:MAG: histidine phosphatase family protein [Proteobacteria bacterium]|nr:histidine phosphatase family protein [Pseudomonadota bacterium]